MRCYREQRSADDVCADHLLLNVLGLTNYYQQIFHHNATLQCKTLSSRGEAVSDLVVDEAGHDTCRRFCAIPPTQSGCKLTRSFYLLCWRGISVGARRLGYQSTFLIFIPCECCQ